MEPSSLASVAFHWNYSADNIPGFADHSLDPAEYNSDFADHTPVHTHSCLIHHRKYSAPESHFCMDRSDMNLPHPLAVLVLSAALFLPAAHLLLAALFLPAAHLLLTALFLSAAVPLLYLLLCYLLSLPLPVIQVPSSVPAASPRNSDRTYNYPISPDNSSYISSSLPHFRKSQFSLFQSTDQFAHLFVLRLYFLYHNINITKKLVSSLKINTFLVSR